MNIWDETKHPITGESSLKEIKPKLIKSYCKDHYFEINYKTREAVCRNCGISSKFIVGKHKLEDGKIKNANR